MEPISVLLRWLGRFGCYLLSILKALRGVDSYHIRADNLKTILIIRLIAIGDSVLLLPALLLLRHHLPRVRIIALATRHNSTIFEKSGLVDNVILLNTQHPVNGLLRNLRVIWRLGREKIDMALDFSFTSRTIAMISYLSNAKYRLGFDTDRLRSKLFSKVIKLDTEKHTALCYLEMVHAIGFPRVPITPFPGLPHRPSDPESARSFLTKHGISDKDPLIVIHPRSGSKNKCWIPQRYAQVADELIDRYHVRIVFTGCPEDREFLRSISHYIQHPTVEMEVGIDFSQLVVLIKRSCLFISVDSGPMHLAAALGIPTIGLFGPGNPCHYKPLGRHCSTLYYAVPCSPCIERGRTRKRECHVQKCMQGISVEDVLKEADCLLSQVSVASDIYRGMTSTG